jgi:hypothetical protein
MFIPDIIATSDVSLQRLAEAKNEKKCSQKNKNKHKKIEEKCGGRGIVEDMCYESRRAEACVD